MIVFWASQDHCKEISFWYFYQSPCMLLYIDQAKFSATSTAYIQL